MNEVVNGYSNADRKTELEILLQEVMEKATYPHDSLEIAAILESLGWIDRRAAERFGVSDIFHLASLLWEMIQERVTEVSVYKPQQVNPIVEFVVLLKSFLRGTIFALPMGISLVAMLTIRLSLWSYQLLSVELATSIGIGTILSFMTIGGFMQAIARTSFFYLNQGFYNIAKRTTYNFIFQGFITCGIVSAIYAIINAYLNIYPFEMVLITIIFYVLLCAIWLSLTVMYVIQKEIIFSGLILLGITIVFFLFKNFHLGIIISQIITLTLVSVIGFVIVIYYYNKLERKMERGIAVGMPRRSVSAFIITPYFLYGLAYFTFLFLDRILAWTTNSSSMPWILWFRGDYELGLDFALLMMILPMGFCEVVVTRFMRRLESQQKNHFVSYDKSCNKVYTKQYIGSLVTIAIVSLISGIIVFFFVDYLNNNLQGILRDAYSFNDVTSFVFIWGLISYGVLSVGVTNAVILFSLSSPNPAVKMMIFAIMLNFVVGFVFTRWFGLEYAVFGNLAGAILFLVGTTRCASKAINSLDYYMYAAS